MNGLKYLFIIAMLMLAGCTTERTGGAQPGTLKFSIEMIKAGPGGQPQLSVPGTVIAYCSVPVLLPEGPRKAIVSNNGMAVEASWDGIVMLQKDSRGPSRVQIKNFRWSLLNPIRYGARVLNLSMPTVRPTLNVGRTLEPLQPPVKLTGTLNDQPWQKDMMWVFGVSWAGGTSTNRVPDIDVTKAYLAKRPELMRGAQPPISRSQQARRAPVRR